ncbi:MAG: ImmA/IrrE family metallo-endopeptidase [Thermoguttaceae bacterium]
MLPELTQEDLSAGLDTIVSEFLDRAHIGRPPVDATEGARVLDIIVAIDDRQSGRARYVRRAGYRAARPKATILLSPDPRPERRQWAVAHEIGEHAAPRIFALLGIDPRETCPDAREQMANHLAGRLLLPTEWFASDAAGCHWDLIALKRRYTTASHELIARRMLECRPPVIISIFDHGQLSFRRSNVPGRAPPLSPIETACRRTVHDANRPEQCFDGLRTVQGWPVHEEDWKREILRAEVDEEEW